MTNTQPLTGQQLTEIDARRQAATPGPWSPYTVHGPTFYANVSGPYLRGVGDLDFGIGEQAEADKEFVRHAREDVDALLAEVHRLRARLADEERQHGQTIDDRDHFHDMADKLAYAVAPEEVIGEHSSMNCPWENALDLITPMPEVEKLREDLERQTALAEQGARANRELSRLRDELAATRTKALATEADEIVLHCPDHGPQDQEGVWMDCHCAVADDMRRRAAASPAV